MSDTVYATNESYELLKAIENWKKVSEDGGTPKEHGEAIKKIRDKANACLGEYDG